MYEIEYSEDAELDLAYFRKFEQMIILTGIAERLSFQPTVENTNRFRRTPPDIAEWELRIGTFRIYYNVRAHLEVVRVERIGEKPNNEVYFRGRRASRT